MFNSRVPIHFYQEKRKILQKAMYFHEKELENIYKEINKINELLEGDERRDARDIPSQSFGVLEEKSR